MEVNNAFNAAVCIIGIALLMIHSVNILLKRGRRKDENALLAFILFTAVHFATYLTYTLIRVSYKSDAMVVGFYTTFYIMNNLELALLFSYTKIYLGSNTKGIKIASVINLATLAIFVALDIINIFTHMFFYPQGGNYQRTDFMIISQGYQFIAFALVFAMTVFSKKLDRIQKIAFVIYCLLPVVAIILQNRFQGYAIAYLSIIVSIEVLFLFVNVRKNILLENEMKRNKEAEIKLMMSQIRPHFIYNALSSISTLITIDPNKAQEGLDAFTDYLRANLSSLGDTGLILVDDELRHIEAYLSLEKMRFGDRLQIAYDIQSKGFMVPPLSIQPIVENAVKHGVLKKIEGGLVSVSTREEEIGYIVEISDNGVGFDVNSVHKDGTQHVGLYNVEYRIQTMAEGSMKIESEINRGTKVTMTFRRR